MNAVLKQDDGRLYAAHRKVYPREVAGRFQRLRLASTVVLLGLFYAVPWLQWRGHQAVLFDLPARKFYIFGLTFFPQDFFLLAWLLIIAALSLFFFTAIAGRLWCGYACPQTVWTGVFVWMERITEGSRQQRMKLDAAPWSAGKLARKAAKQLLWVTFAVATGVTFVGYFTAIRTLSGFDLHGWEAFWIVFYGFATYGNAGHLREQVCKYMCPYARFQGAMFDRNTLVISYDAARGDPRGARSKRVDPRKQGLGDCVDCTVCVQACPTGIDIRNGLQLECIACAACIDACDDVMDRLQYPRGLIRYSTQNAMDGRKTHVVRLRTLIYGALLLALTIGFGVAVHERPLLVLDVMRDRNALFRVTDMGNIENVYTIRLVNKDSAPHTVRLAVDGLAAAVLEGDRSVYVVDPESVLSATVRIHVPPQRISGGRDIVIRAQSTDERIDAKSKARFIGPAS